jgi:hypothetical protein
MRIIEQTKTELEVGIEIEHEHLPTLNKIKNFYKINNDFPSIEQVAEWIAEDHLKEFENYYNDEDGLPEMERRLKTKN